MPLRGLFLPGWLVSKTVGRISSARQACPGNSSRPRLLKGQERASLFSVGRFDDLTKGVLADADDPDLALGVVL